MIAEYLTIHRLHSRGRANPRNLSTQRLPVRGVLQLNFLRLGFMGKSTIFSRKTTSTSYRRSSVAPGSVVTHSCCLTTNKINSTVLPFLYTKIFNYTLCDILFAPARCKMYLMTFMIYFACMGSKAGAGPELWFPML